jgi:Fur family ferric uptake transcriptional regulator
VEDDILTALGIKVTKQRKVIIEILENATKPMTVEDIYDKIDKENRMNFSTVYRTINMLSEKGVLKKIGKPGGKVYYEIYKHKHHHILECSECKAQIEIDQCPIEALEVEINEKTGFVITEHSLKLEGLCPRCAHKDDKNE